MIAPSVSCGKILYHGWKKNRPSNILPLNCKLLPHVQDRWENFKRFQSCCIFTLHKSGYRSKPHSTKEISNLRFSSIFLHEVGLGIYFDRDVTVNFSARYSVAQYGTIICPRKSDFVSGWSYPIDSSDFDKWNWTVQYWVKQSRLSKETEGSLEDFR